MLDLSWGGYRNGYIPDSAMSPIDSQGHRLESTAAAEFLAMQAAMLRDLGRTISVAPGDDSAFRTIAQQQVDYDLYMQGGNVASAPGLSNHGWGRAVDITGYEVHDDVWNWLLTHAAAYGYSHATGALSGERWHWECTTTPGTVAVGGNATPLTPEIKEAIMVGSIYLVQRIADGDATLNGMTCAMGPGYFQHLGGGDLAGIARDLKIPDAQIIKGQETNGGNGLPAIEFSRLVSLFQIPPGNVHPGGRYLAGGAFNK
jgi:hypothetical protein